jgi:hypothetical protein
LRSRDSADIRPIEGGEPSPFPLFDRLRSKRIQLALQFGGHGFELLTVRDFAYSIFETPCAGDLGD